MSDLQSRLDTILEPVVARYPIERVLLSLESIEEPTLYGYLPDTVTSTFELVSREHGETVLGQYKKRVIIALIDRLESRVDSLRLPQSVVELYPDTLEFIVEDLLTIADAEYLKDRSAVVRELRLTSARTLPCGGGIIDNSTYLPKTFYRNQGKLQNAKCLWFVYARMGGLSPLFRIHTDTRYLKDFNEAGRCRCYLRIAELMRRDPAIRGLVGTSWFYDPALEKISPWLAHFRQRPERNGAYLRCDGPGDIHTQRATATSRTRRKLYEQGKYIPKCYTLVWARRDLLRWADEYESRGA